MKKILYTIVLLQAAWLAGCNNFLDVKPKGFSIPETTEDYEQLITGESFTTYVPYAAELLYLGDDMYHPTFAEDMLMYPDPLSNLYCWKQNIDIDASTSPVLWGPMYNNIYVANLVIAEVMDSKAGNYGKKTEILAEASFRRAQHFFLLMTLYAPPYDEATADTDLGVPLQTSTEITDKTQPRSTVRQCMDFIFADLNVAIRNLPVASPNNNKYRPSKYAAYALAARAYLTMREYDKMETYADSALMGPHALTDYNVCTVDGSFPPLQSSVQELWSADGLRKQTGLYNYLTDYAIGLFSDDAKEHDLRYSYFTVDAEVMWGTGVYRRKLVSPYVTQPVYEAFTPNLGMGYPEVYLMKAEGMLRNGKPVDVGLEWLNKLRRCRITPDGEVDLTTNDREEALQYVLDERVRELLTRGVRWMDMRRLDKEDRMGAVERYDIDEEWMATLEPHDLAYTLQIPVSVLVHNPGMPKNPR